MKVLVFTKGDGPEMRDALDLGKELEDEKVEVEYLDTEEPEGVSSVELYDIYSTPSFVITRDDGSIVNVWRGTIPPRSDIFHDAMG
ncbi:hypothetical protein COY62_01875 [bacterium (Candidatus Howlettbacteria) CG_4_10_14_0_8_um_filter_40_9]|nr:MAG: hypothetical protein COY62_01875 [bacterium (Candidatus Howlettbacteria) CG_4_10_14_0_8_um_filter_40_9]